ncbi:MAG: hypothetical protein Nkreftii_002949 [Candidatus Nitrospira kreftii]|uniref:Uncharacterized protein n=1 Tax=Candidatus Nitrospira kreftii TaxID=2652173 RepID=A0A7S8J0N2_9BACT|nr:MAG: hypothetical protein Nkreftii_002949 [Candidatus Nitrospira kreftii]
MRYRIDKLSRSVDNPTTLLGGTRVQDITLDGRSLLGLFGILFLVLSGCNPDDSPIRADNEVLKKQVARQESLLSSLQDGNKVMQQQIDLLNQELRDAKKLTDELDQQLDEAKEMIGTQVAQSLKVEDKDAQSETLPRPLEIVAKVAEEALARNGYRLKVSVKTDQRAVYVTERKISNPATLEVTGSRNQYLVALEALPNNSTKLAVKAEFERIAQGGRVLSVSAEETMEIEQRLIRELSKALATPAKT